MSSIPFYIELGFSKDEFYSKLKSVIILELFFMLRCFKKKLKNTLLLVSIEFSQF